MPNSFLGFPVRRALLADYAKKTETLLSVYSDPGINLLELWMSLDGWGQTKSSGAVISIGSNKLTLKAPKNYGGSAQVDKTPNLFVTTPTWAKKTKWKTDCRLVAETPGAGQIWILSGGPGTERHAGFVVDAGKLYGTVSNGTTEVRTAALANWSGSAYDKTVTLELDYKATSADFYFNDTLSDTLSTGLPTGTAWADTLFYANPYMDDNQNALYFYSSYLKLWKEQ
jgi:hypothetical protein